jgi:hypothetical protein
VISVLKVFEVEQKKRNYASESDSSKPVDGSGNSPDSRIAPQSRHSTYSASESLAISRVREWRQEAGSFTQLLLSYQNHNTSTQNQTESPPNHERSPKIPRPEL